MTSRRYTAYTSLVGDRQKSVSKHDFFKYGFVLVVAARVRAPTYDSQLKQKLTTPAPFAKEDLPEAELVAKAVKKLDIVRRLDAKARAKMEKTQVTKASRQVKATADPNLEDALLADKKHVKRGEPRTLWLVEGLSAKTMAVTGFSVIGRDLNGVLPLRGKVTNALEATQQKLLESAPIKAIMNALGMDPAKPATDASKLRYQKVCILTDADADGAHIAGLLVTFFSKILPELIKKGDFVYIFRTPVVIANQKDEFHSIRMFDEWFNKLPVNARKPSVQYLKGLGSSTRAQALGYFKSQSTNKKRFRPAETEDFESITTAFGKTPEDMNKRRKLIEDHLTRDGASNSDAVGGHLDAFDTLEASDYSISDLIKGPVASFFRYDCARSLSSFADGLKVSQRKAISYVLTESRHKVLKVGALTSSVMNVFAYLHGDASMNECITRIAQDYVGSNQIPLLTGHGQFGSRSGGGKDYASARYISVSLNEKVLDTLIYDDELLVVDRMVEEGLKVEHVFIPMALPIALINGCSGLGAGFRCDVYTFDIQSVTDRLVAVLEEVDGDMLPHLVPGFKGIQGKFVASDKEKESYASLPVIKDDAETNSCKISDLGVGIATSAAVAAIREIAGVEEVNNRSSDIVVDIEVKYAAEKRADVLKGIIGKTTSRFSNQLNLLDDKRCLVKFNNENDIIEAFARIRIEVCTRARENSLVVLRDQHELADAKKKFVEAVVGGKLAISTSSSRPRNVEDIKRDVARILGQDSTDKYFERCIAMRFSSFTSDKVDELDAEISKLHCKIQKVESTTPRQMAVSRAKKACEAFA